MGQILESEASSGLRLNRTFNHTRRFVLINPVIEEPDDLCLINCNYSDPLP